MATSRSPKTDSVANHRSASRFDNPFDPEIKLEDIERVLAEGALQSINPDAFPGNLSLKDLLRNDARFCTYRPGDIIVRIGDYGNSAMIILEGSVRVLRHQDVSEAELGRSKTRKLTWLQLLKTSLKNLVRRDTYSEIRRGVDLDFHKSHDAVDGISRLKNYEPILEKSPLIRLSEGQMFGEIAALTRSPRNASIVAETQVRCLEIRWQGIRDIRRFDKGFRQQVDQLYRERSLKTHLGLTDLFKELPEEILEILVQETCFDSFGDFNWDFNPPELANVDPRKRLDREPLIVGQDDYVNDLILIRAGFARVSKAVNFGHRTTGYLSSGDVFGLEEALSNFQNGTQEPYRSSLRATGYVDIIRVPIPVLEKHVFPTLLAKKPAKSQRTESQNGIRNAQGSGLDGFLDFIVDNRFNNGTASMVIDLNRCTGCDDCLRACANAHDGNVKFVRDGVLFGNYQVVNACMHCVDPICMIGCPTGAIHRNPDGGQVLINDMTCIGCGSCSGNCPYGAIQMVPIRSQAGSFWLAKSSNSPTTQAPLFKATKCDLCFNQKTGPACAYACPHDALERVDMKDFTASGEGL